MTGSIHVLAVALAALCNASCGTSDPLSSTDADDVDQKIAVNDVSTTCGLIQFGNAIAVAGDTAVIGARGDNTIIGSAYVFRRDSNKRWQRVRKLTASDAPPPPSPTCIGSSDILSFGVAVAISGDTIVVGAYSAKGATRAEGAAYIYERNVGGPDKWGEVKKLLPADPVTNGEFGWSVDIEGDTVIVGQPTITDGVNSAAYVFMRNAGGPGNWGQVQKLEPEPGENSFFGWAVDLSGEELLVGSAGFSASIGAAYLHQRDVSGQWQLVKRLVASDGSTGDTYGATAVLDADTALVGGPPRTGSMSNGSLYVYSREGGGWGEVAKITHPDSANDPDSDFARVAALRDDTLLVGAPFSDRDGTAGAGAVFVFKRVPAGAGTWTFAGTLRRGDAMAGDNLGGGSSGNREISFAGDQVLVGAVGSDDAGTDFGAVYVFHLPEPP